MKISLDARRIFYKENPYRIGFSSKARLLQNIYLLEKGLVGEGTLLNEEYARKTGKNFLTKKIFDLVKKEINDRNEKGKVIAQPRIWINLLSSQPLAFNLFGELVDNPTLATCAFKEIFPESKIKKIREIKFEYSPGRKNPKYTDDKSAFDVFIKYENDRGEFCFFGIEVKYSESLNDNPSRHKARYDELAGDAGIFNPEKHLALREKPIQQIWRDHLLAISMFKSNKDYKRGDFIFLFPAGNVNCRQAIEKYQATFLPDKETFFRKLTLEEMVAALKRYSAETWIRDFEERYLKFDRI